MNKEVSKELNKELLNEIVECIENNEFNKIDNKSDNIVWTKVVQVVSEVMKIEHDRIMLNIKDRLIRYQRRGIVGGKEIYINLFIGKLVSDNEVQFIINIMKR